MVDKSASIKELAAALEDLVRRPPRTKAELKLWELEAKRLADELIVGRGLHTEAPHFLWDYLLTASTRFNDEWYAQQQQPILDVLLEYLKKGIMPKDSDIP